MKIQPIIRPDSITDEMAIDILKNAIFNMTMSDNLENQTLCLLAAINRGMEALKEKIDQEERHE